MIKKKWEEYTQEEKKKLLFHTFLYYGDIDINLETLKEYRRLILTNPDEILRIYIASIYLNFNPQEAIAKAINENKLDLLYELSKPIDFNNNDVKETLNTFLEKIITSYNIESVYYSSKQFK